MANKKYMVLDPEGNHDYNIIVSETDEGLKQSLVRSNAEHWLEHVRGKVVLEMVDNGDGIKFNKKLKNVDYSILCEMRILINFSHQTDEYEINREKHQIIELSNTFKV